MKTHDMNRTRQTSFSRKLRRNQTDAEKTLWARLRNRQYGGAKLRRQHPIGPYIVDFVDLATKLVIELDGGQHSEDFVQQKDDERTAWLESEGYPHPSPLPSRERGHPSSLPLVGGFVVRSAERELDAVLSLLKEGRGRY